MSPHKIKKQQKNSQQSGQQDYILNLTFEGPLLSQAAGTMALGLDVEMQKAPDGKPVLNGSLIRGNIRHALAGFAKLLDDEKLSQEIKHWFGHESESGNYKPQRAHANFDFFWRLAQAYDEQKVPNQRTRIEINRESGTVNEGSLQVVEDCFPIGSENPVFSGKITLHYEDPKEKLFFNEWIEKALDYVPAMGSFKGTGFGRLVNAELKEIENKAPLNTSTPDEHTHFGIRLKIDRPFCVGRPRTSDSNLIVSEEVITGNLIKALIARAYNNNTNQLRKRLCFDQLIIGHALPTPKETSQREMPLPLSLAILDKKVIDMAMSQTIKKWEQIPSFAPDWKKADQALINDFIKQPDIHPKRLLTLRTEINAENGTSKESRLFSQECIDPSEHDWCADVNLSNIPKNKRTTVFKALQNIFDQGLTGIGKTKAQATVTLTKSPFTQKSAELKPGQQIITLTTAARMLPPDLRMHGTNSAQTLKTAYQTYWRKILSDDIENENIQLMSYYAQQTLASSYYHQQRHHPEQEKYYPEWLTNAGSVFVLKIDDDKALKKLEEFSHTGLTAHAEADKSAANWKTTPYLPEHGYGEIQVKAMGESK